MSDKDRIEEEALAEIERLRSALEAIKKATIEGRVCDDVAWFDTITTLHDFCEQTLSLC
jgi:hypothetical protein